jgi:hypothetical protein
MVVKCPMPKLEVESRLSTGATKCLTPSSCLTAVRHALFYLDRIFKITPANTISIPK